MQHPRVQQDSEDNLIELSGVSLDTSEAYDAAGPVYADLEQCAHMLFARVSNCSQLRVATVPVCRQSNIDRQT